MPFQLDLFSDMEECDQDVSVVDVYDIASEIGKEFEKIIDTHGTEAVTSLMPKVINALEHLERLATKNDRENTTVQELRARIMHLENDKIEKAEGRLRFEKELEQIEEHWRQESRDLLSMVTRLQDENRRLSSSLAERDGMRGDGSGPGGGQEDSLEGGAMTGDWELLCRLRQTVERQREAVRSRDNELLAKNSEIEALQEQVERLSMVGRELRRKHHSAQAQVRGLVDERADFLAQLQDQQREIGRLRQRLGIAQKENEDLTESLDQNPSIGERYHPDDPERPRFTTAELKEILHERNELKARVSDLEDELETYRPKAKNEEEEKTATEEDAPVQGPLPFEPDDAPWKRSDSGIRKFFRKLLGESGISFLGGGGSSPKRSLSSLSKLALAGCSPPEAENTV